LAEELARAERELGPVQGPIARQRYDEAMRTTTVPPADMRAIATELRGRGYPRIADTLEARAAELESGTPAPAPAPAPAPGPAPAPAPYSPAVPETPATPTPGAVATPEPAIVPSPTTETPPSPATASTYNAARARTLAPRVAENVRTRAYSYNRADVRAFQEAAGLNPDGIYGGVTRDALRHFGVRRPPAALFAPTTGTYTPPA
jgi:peptidoglycan hydrolase-like protein with peptidoglycan-binding domain